jgi:hypothetical protein
MLRAGQEEYLICFQQSLCIGGLPYPLIFSSNITKGFYETEVPLAHFETVSHPRLKLVEVLLLARILFYLNHDLAHIVKHLMHLVSLATLLSTSRYHSAPAML